MSVPYIALVVALHHSLHQFIVPLLYHIEYSFDSPDVLHELRRGKGIKWEGKCGNNGRITGSIDLHGSHQTKENDLFYENYSAI
jgi:hypothetical protein